MASSRSLADTTTDRDVCSMCLEDFTGRCPKILPCSHTFCLSCLTELVRQAEMKSSTALTPNSQDCCGEICTESHERALPLTLPCPICRTDITVPDQGVAEFQTNFDVPGEEACKTSKPALLCGLCDEDQEAKYSCDDCKTNFCKVCDRVHRKLMTSHQTQPLTSAFQIAEQNASNLNMQAKVDEQIKTMEAALAAMGEIESEMECQLQEKIGEIDARYNVLMNFAIQAVEQSKRSLEMKAQLTRNKLKSDMTNARHSHRNLWCVPSSEDTTGQTLQTTPLLKEEDLKYYTQIVSLRGKQKRFFPLQVNGSALSLATVQDYIGTVNNEEEITFTSLEFITGANEISSFHDYSSIRLNQAEGNQHPDLNNEGVQLIGKETASSKINEEIALLKDENAKLKESLFNLQALITDVMNGTSDLREENVRIKDERIKLQTDVTALQGDYSQLHQVSSKVTNDVTALQGDYSQLHQVSSKLTNDVTALQGDYSQLHQVSSKLTNDVTALKGDYSQLRHESSKLTNDVTTLQEGFSYLHHVSTMITQDVTQLKGGYSELHQASTKLTSDNTSTQKTVKQLEKNFQLLKSEYTLAKPHANSPTTKPQPTLGDHSGHVSGDLPRGVSRNNRLQ